MAGLLLINFIVSVVMLALSVHRATGEGCAMEFYPATIPTMVQAGLAVAAALMGLLSRRARFACLIASSALLGLLCIPALCALSSWPGGDDGGSLGWFFIVVGGSAVSFVIAMLTLIIGVVLRRWGKSALSGQPCTTPPVPPRHDVESLTVADPDRQIAMPRPTARRVLWILWGLMAAAGLYLVWIVLGPISWSSTRVNRYPGGIEIRSIDLHELCALFLLPFYHHVDTDHEQILLVNGREVLRSSTTHGHLYPSPLGTFAVVEDWMHGRPILIYDLADLNCKAMPVETSRDEFPDHYYVYPFGFLRWEDDSSFLVEVTGCDWTSATGAHYRQVWRVAAKTGARSRVE